MKMLLRRSLALSIALLWVEYLAGNVGNAATEPGLKNSLQQTCEVDRICTAVANETTLRKHKHGYYPTVDIFYMYSENNKYLYMREGHYWTMASVANKFSSHNPLTNRSDVRIHIAVNSDAMLEQAQKFGYHAYDLRVFSANHEQFKANIHKTVTSLEYELTIFRWKVYNSIVTDWNKQHSPEEQIKRIICADGDVLMTMSPAKFYHDVMQTFVLNSTIPHLDHNHKPDHGNAHNVTHHHKKDRELDYQLINLAYGVMCLFSPRGLASFDGFIDEWYSGPEEDVIARSNAAGGGKYWSDMMLLERFMFTEITERNNCFEYDRYKNYYEDWKKAPSSQCLLKALQCIPMSNYHAQGIVWGLHFVVNHQRTVLTKHNHVHTVNKDTLSIYGAQEKYPYCFMHFQGNGMKSLMYTYGRVFEILLDPVRPAFNQALHANNNNSSALTTVEVGFHGGIILRPESSSKLYYIFTNATRYRLSGPDEVNALGLGSEPIYVEVPFEIITVFPPVHAHHDE